LYGGYAPTPIYRLYLDAGQTVVFKGVGPTGFENEFMRGGLRIEERTYRELGEWLLPWAPALLGAFEQQGWHVLLLEDLGPARIPPWTPDAVAAVMRSFAAFHAHSLGQLLPEWLRPLHVEFGRDWANVEAEGLEPLASVWLATHVRQLRDCAAQLAHVAEPYALLHFDTRSDNIRLHGDQLRIFDWPQVSIGPPELDVVPFAQSVTVEGGPDPEAVLAAYPGELRQDVTTSAVVAMAGFFANRAWRPAIPGLPRVRDFQGRQLNVTLAWAACRLNLPAPDNF
jgi:hypothetical protein